MEIVHGSLIESPGSLAESIINVVNSDKFSSFLHQANAAPVGVIGVTGRFLVKQDWPSSFKLYLSLAFSPIAMFLKVSSPERLR